MKPYRKILFFLVFPILFLGSFGVAQAEITRPYTVDEKQQVLFGDSIDVEESPGVTYFGLENFVYDYVGGYLHITFTYTHAQGSFTGTPPLLYVTSTDPRTVFIQNPKALLVTQQLVSQPTDWYLFDIQFDSSGVNISVKQKGITEIISRHEPIDGLSISDWVALANTATLQNPANQFSMSFTPIPLRDLSGNSNILFLPGFMGSRLYKPETNFNKRLWEPSLNSDLNDLHLLDNNDTKINSGIFTTDIIDEDKIRFKNIYKSFINRMDDLVSDGTINDWEPYAYDWRNDILDIVSAGTPYENETVLLEDVLSDLAENSDSGKVTIVAHSNGGLLAKMFIKKLVDDKVAGRNFLIDRIDKLILVAVPQLGAPAAIPALLHGYNQDLAHGFLLNEAEARAMGERASGTYGLLPSSEYFNVISNPVINFVTNNLDLYMTNDIGLYGNSIDSYSELRDFLIGGNGRPDPTYSDTLKPLIISSNLLDNQNFTHNLIDNLIIPSHIEVTEVAGWGIDTIYSFKYSSTKLCSNPTDAGCTGDYYLDQIPLFTIDGDKTVVVPSAHRIAGANKYWVDFTKYNGILRINRQHKDLLEVNALLDLISSKIKNINFPGSVYVSASAPVDTEGRFRLSVHSPVTIEAYDIDGNHTGKICPPATDICYAEENIPNSSYLEFGEGKYLNIPEEELDKVVLRGTDIGTFTFNTTRVLPDNSEETFSFIDIPVTGQLRAEVFINHNTGEPYMEIDTDGDGVVDLTLGSSPEFDPIAFLETMKATVNLFDISNNKKKTLIKRIDKIINLIEKGKIDRTELKAEKFTSKLEKRMDKKDPKKPKPNKLSKEDAQILLDMLEELLDNLE